MPGLREQRSNQVDRDALDVLIVGAGLSGIGAACHLRMACPDKRFTMLEARDGLGGTWDLFRYPGVRSDSSMYTLGYAFRPWTRPKAIADGPSILAYLRETAQAYGVDRAIQYGLRVEHAAWSSEQARWTVTARELASGRVRTFRCAFLFMCAGYYEYERGYTPPFPGTERFRGRIVHPQHWPSDLDYAGRRVLVIGSGATAVTLVPELAKRAAHVTMLQRTPSYIVSAPDRDALAELAGRLLPERHAYALTRWKNVFLAMAFYGFSRGFPQAAKRYFIDQMRKQIGHKVDVDTHFTPPYDPWDQRVCLGPNGDIFEAICTGRASVVTDQIDTFTEAGVRLCSGRELEADVIVTATGFKLRLLGGAALELDGAPVELASRLTYKGMMLNDVPNFAFALGYTNASWTLKCDLVCEYVCRLLKHMDRHGYRRCCPRNHDPALRREPMLRFSSGYVRRSIRELPTQGARVPWRLYQNYVLDRLLLRHARIEDRAMEFS